MMLSFRGRKTQINLVAKREKCALKRTSEVLEVRGGVQSEKQPQVKNKGKR